MWILITAIFTASLLGSMHCVGMCGPLAMWASGVGERASRSTVMLSTTLYHLGRCITYLMAGVIAGAIGSAIDIGGQWLGFQVAAARVVGAIMVVVGASKLWTLARGRGSRGNQLRPSRIGGLLVKLRPTLFRLPLTGRAFATGLLTTLLPCGWLYLFALFAAGTGSPVMGPVVMFAFWLGTVPALTALIAGSQVLSRKFTLLVPAAAAVLLIMTGCYTASGRGFARLDSLASLRSSAGMDSEDPLLDQVHRSDSISLPCCSHTADACEVAK